MQATETKWLLHSVSVSGSLNARTHLQQPKEPFRSAQVPNKE